MVGGDDVACAARECGAALPHLSQHAPIDLVRARVRARGRGRGRGRGRVRG